VQRSNGNVKVEAKPGFETPLVEQLLNAAEGIPLRAGDL
jgi:hypothetical protein